MKDRGSHVPSNRDCNLKRLLIHALYVTPKLPLELVAAEIREPLDRDEFPNANREKDAFRPDGF